MHGPAPVRLEGRRAATAGVLDADTAEVLRNFLPPLQREATCLRLVYSIDQDGISLLTLFARARERTPTGGPVLLAVRDASSRVFGAFLSEPPGPRRGFYGNGACFLWRRNERGSISAYLATGKNSYYILSESGADLALGGGDGKFGLWIDDQLYKGHTAECPTFDNEPLIGVDSESGGAFEIHGLELWSFIM
ncbi:TLD-domain-containing protein [Entophlyctis helioformis]|nr:TLD-domain-containing protein [Entophlyctis helioformis]